MKDSKVFLMAAVLFGAWYYKKNVLDRAALLPVADSNEAHQDTSLVAPGTILDMKNDAAINLDILDNPSPTNRPNPSALLYQVANEEETMFAGSSLG